MAAIAVVVDNGSGEIEPTAPIVASSTVAAVCGSSNDGAFTTASHDNNRHSYPHYPRPCPRPCPPLDKDWMAGWRVCHDASHFGVALVIVVGAIFFSTGMAPRTTAAVKDKAITLISVAGKRLETTTHQHGATKTNTKTKTKSTTVAATSPHLYLQTATAAATSA
jgi:hypothetical protein